MQLAKAQKLSGCFLGASAPKGSASPMLPMLQEEVLAGVAAPDGDVVQDGTGLPGASAGDIRPRGAFWKAEAFSVF